MGVRFGGGAAKAAALVAALGLAMAGSAAAQDAARKGDGDAGAGPKVKLGLSAREPGAFAGYTVLNPMGSKTTYLMDLDGRVVKSWESDMTSHHKAIILEDGHLLRVGDLEGEERKFGGGGGSAGRVQERTWDGELVWDFKLHNDKQLLHHDVVKLPNGNVLMIVWDKKTEAEAVAAGRRPEFVKDFLLPDSVLEVKPTGKDSGEVVWEWHLWDHLVQDYDEAKPNYGKPEDHPELVDLNYVEDTMAAAALKKEDLEKLQSLGYVGSVTGRPGRVSPDWNHVNSIDYNPEYDQILLSIHEFSEIWVIDHGTTTAEAAGHSGGKAGKGGDLLYRWGNPRVYHAGTVKDQQLFAQHNAQWIKEGLPGAGHILIFNNGLHRPGGEYSTIEEIAPPVDDRGRYAREPGKPFGPSKPEWTYAAPEHGDFYSSFISGVQRLPNGNTLICSGANGTIFEVTPGGEVVWKYINPVKENRRQGPPPPLARVLDEPAADRLKLSDEQRKDLEAFQKQVDERLEKALTEEQRRMLRDGGRGPGAPTPPGQLIPLATQIRLKPTAEQKAELASLQKDADERLASLLNEEQEAELKTLQAEFGRGGPRAGGPGRPPGGGGPPGRGGPPGGEGLFRANRYPVDYPGLAGRELTPGKTVEELQPKAGSEEE
jgi:hypothetical protein